jgi:hypothetical protein
LPPTNKDKTWAEIQARIEEIHAEMEAEFQAEIQAKETAIRSTTTDTDQAMPYQAMPSYAKPCQSMPFQKNQTMPYHAKPCQAMQTTFRQDDTTCRKTSRRQRLPQKQTCRNYALNRDLWSPRSSQSARKGSSHSARTGE